MSAQSLLLVPTILALALSGKAVTTGPASPAEALEARAALAEPTWGPVKELDENPRGQSLAVDARNDVTVVWSSTKTFPQSIMALRHPAGGTWGTPVVIGHGIDPQVAADAQGNVTVVWLRQRRGFTDGVVSARRPATGRWSDPVRISRDLRVPGYPGDGKGPYGAEDVDLAVSSRGAVVAVWAWGSDERRKPWRIQSAYRAPGRAWSEARDVTPANGAKHPQVGIDAHGTGVLLYGRQSLGHPQVLEARRRLVGLGWTRPTTVAAEGYAESLAVDPAGNAVVAFSPDFATVRAVYRPAAGRWGTARRLSPPGVEVSDFALAMSRRGAVVAMARANGSVDLVRRPPRGPWSAPVQVAAAQPWVFEVVAAVNDAGDTFVGWGGYALYGRYRPQGGPWTGTDTLSPDAGVEVLEATLGQVAPNGDVAVLWAQEDLPLKVRLMATP